MKQIDHVLRYALLTALLAVGFSVSAWANTTETYFFSTADGVLFQNVSRNGFDISVVGGSSAAVSRSNGMRVYGGGSLIITSKSPTANIVSIAYSLTLSDSKANALTSTPTGFNSSKKIWQSATPASSVSLKTGGTSGYCAYTKVVVTFSDAGALPSAGFAFSPSAQTLTVGDAFTSPVLSTAAGYDGTVVYASDNTSLATVSETGAVSLVDGATGTAKITATAAATEHFAAGYAECTITVNDRVERGQQFFYESFDQFVTHQGGNDGNWNGSFFCVPFGATASESSDNTGWTNVEGYECYKCVCAGISDRLGSFTTPAIAITGNAILTFKAAAWNIKAENTTLKIKATNATLEKGTVEMVKGAFSDYTVNITNVTGPVKITFEGFTQNYSRFFLDEVRVVSSSVPVEIAYDDLYATLYYSNKSLTVPAGIVATTYAVADGTLSETKRYEEGDVIPQATAVVMKADEKKTYYFEPTTAQGEAPTQNMLCGTDAAALTTAPAGMGDVYYYMLTYAANSTDPATLGFYWGNATGAAFTNGAHKAYLVAPQAQSNSIRAFVIGGHGGTTAITAATVGTPDADAPAYNLAGQRVGAAYKGLVITKGKKQLRR